MNSFAGGILSDSRLSPIQTDTAVSKTGKVGAAWTLRCGYRQNFTGEGRDWARSSDGWGRGGEKSWGLISRCPHAHGCSESHRGRARREEKGDRLWTGETGTGKWRMDRQAVGLSPSQGRTQHAYPIFSPPHLSSTQATHHASAAMVGQDEL
jgi:hypothetical protein